MGSPLSGFARGALWSLPVWSFLLFVTTTTHQPDPATEFDAYARYITTDIFLVSHIFGSIVGAAIGTIGFVALFVRLASENLRRLSVMALVTAIAGNTLVTSIFGVAAFAQPAIGELHFSGSSAQAMAVNTAVYGIPLFATAGIGLLLFASGLVMFGIAVARSGFFPNWSGILLAVGGLLFTIIGFLFVDIMQPVGALLMMVGTAGIAMRYRVA
jgi:hypothetical protein